MQEHHNQQDARNSAVVFEVPRHGPHHPLDAIDEQNYARRGTNRLHFNNSVRNTNTFADGAVFVRNVDNRYRQQVLANIDPAEKEEADRQAEREIRESEGILLSVRLQTHKSSAQARAADDQFDDLEQEQPSNDMHDRVVQAL